MVNVSHEPWQETDRRLRALMPAVRLTVFDAAFHWAEFPLAAFAAAVRPDVLALVRDDELWSQLVPGEDPQGESFTLFRFHFPEDLDNSGFVGWLASHLKQTFGTGVFVTCGQNSSAGGIYDYWGCPRELGPEILAEVRGLISAGEAAGP